MAALAPSPAPAFRGSPRMVPAIAVALAHAGVAAALLLVAPVRERLIEPPPLVVDLVGASPEKVRDAAPPKPVLSPAPQVVLAPPVFTVAPEIPVAVPAESRPAITVPVAAAPAAPPTEAAQAVEPPRFDMSYLRNPPPVYPMASRRKGEQGRVMLSVLVNASGDAETVEVKASSGSSHLDRAAVDAVKRWKFEPARRGAKPVAGWALVPIDFQLGAS